MIKLLRFLPFVFFTSHLFFGADLSERPLPSQNPGAQNTSSAVVPFDLPDDVPEGFKRAQAKDGRILNVLDLRKYFPKSTPWGQEKNRRYREDMHVFLARAQEYIEHNHPELITEEIGKYVTEGLLTLFRFMARSMYNDSLQGWWCFKRVRATLPNQEQYNDLLRRYLTFYNTTQFHIIVDATLMKTPTCCGLTLDRESRRKPTSILKGPSKMLAVFEESYRKSQEEGFSYRENESALVRTKPNVFWQLTKHFSMLGLPRFFVNPRKNLSSLLKVWPIWGGEEKFMLRLTTKKLIRLINDTPLGLLKSSLAGAIEEERERPSMYPYFMDKADRIISHIEDVQATFDGCWCWFLLAGSGAVICNGVLAIIMQTNGDIFATTLFPLEILLVLWGATAFDP